MRPPAHTDLEIIKAGRSLQNEGKKVTGYSLAQALGGGKQSRLAEVWSAYQANGNNELRGKSEAKPPQDIEDDFFVVKHLVSSVSGTLISTADRLLEKLAEDLQLETEKRVEHLVDMQSRFLEEENGALRTKLDRALVEIEQWKSHREQWLKDMADRQKQIDELTRELGSLRNKLYKLEKPER